MLESAPPGNAVIAAPASPPRLRVGPPRDWAAGFPGVDPTICRFSSLAAPGQLQSPLVRRPLSILTGAMLSPSSVYPARPPRPPFVAPRVFVVLRGISRCLAPDILQDLAGEHSGACGRLDVLRWHGHARNIRSAGLRTPAGPRLRTCV